VAKPARQLSLPKLPRCCTVPNLASVDLANWPAHGFVGLEALAMAASSRSSSGPSVHPSSASARWTRSACIASAWADVGAAAVVRPGACQL
jgi:hypothetical protein